MRACHIRGGQLTVLVLAGAVALMGVVMGHSELCHAHTHYFREAFFKAGVGEDSVSAFGILSVSRKRW